jgi:hypothetical protein
MIRRRDEAIRRRDEAQTFTNYYFTLPKSVLQAAVIA